MICKSSFTIHSFEGEERGSETSYLYFCENLDNLNNIIHFNFKHNCIKYLMNVSIQIKKKKNLHIIVILKVSVLRLIFLKNKVTEMVMDSKGNLMH